MNFCGVKNAVGSFHAPVLVVCCTDFLKTLPLRELHSGIGEIIKYAVIGGDSILNLLQGGIINNAALISACCEIKRKFVEEDEFDNGTRRILNLGHTFGHVLKRQAAFRSVTAKLSDSGSPLLRISVKNSVSQNAASLKKSFHCFVSRA